MSRIRFVDIVCRVLVLIGLAVFAVAIFFPFMTGVYPPMMVPRIRVGPIQFWSFMRRVTYYSTNGWILGSGITTQTDWLAVYWGSMFNSPSRVPVWLAGVAVVGLFVLQIAVFVSGTIAIVRPRIGFVVAPFLLSVFCLFFMIAFISSSSSYLMAFYDLGFWFTLCSIVLFVLATLVNGFGILLNMHPRENSYSTKFIKEI